MPTTGPLLLGGTSRLRSQARALWDGADRFAPWILLAVAFWVRVQNLDTSPYGDESYWFFTAQKLSHFLNTQLYPLSGSEFPVFPVVFRPFAHSLIAARIANAVAGAALVPIGMYTLRSVGVAQPWRWAAGLLLALDQIMVQFSAYLFLDMLGATIAAAALLAYVQGRYRWAALCATAAVLEKEYFAIFAAALFLDYVARRRRLYRELIGAAVVVLVYMALRYGVFHASLQYLLTGHAHDRLSVESLGWALGSSWFLAPLIVASALLDRSRLLAAALFVVGFLLFLWRWGNTEIWYLVGPASFAIMLAADGADRLCRLFQRNALRTAAAVVATLLLAGGIYQNWQLTTGFNAAFHDHSITNLSAYLEAENVNGPINLIGCFWAYKYYPFGPPLAPAPLNSWSGARAAQAISCPGSPAPPAGWQSRFNSAGYTYWTR